MFDPLLEEDPWIQELSAAKEAKGKAEGKLEEARSLLVKFVQKRFPALFVITQTKAAQIDQLDVLHALTEQLWLVPDEQAAGLLLEAAFIIS